MLDISGGELVTKEANSIGTGRICKGAKPLSQFINATLPRNLLLKLVAQPRVAGVKRGSEAGGGGIISFTFPFERLPHRLPPFAQRQA